MGGGRGWFFKVCPVVFLYSHQPFLHTMPRALSYNHGMQKIHVWMFVPPSMPCASLVFCAFVHCPMPSYWQMYFSYPEYGKLGQNLVKAPDDPRFFSEWHGGLLLAEYASKHDWIPFHLLCPRKDDAHWVFFFLPRFFLGFSFYESSLFFVSLVFSFFRRLLGGLH